jgi:hypothetical protein
LNALGLIKLAFTSGTKSNSDEDKSFEMTTGFRFDDVVEDVVLFNLEFTSGFTQA